MVQKIMVDKNEKIILYGCGEHCMNLLQQYLFPVKNIAMIVDSNPNIAGRFVFNNTVCLPNKIKECDSHVVVVGSKIHFEEIKRLVLEINPELNIILIDDYLVDYPKADTVTLVYGRRQKVHNLIEKMKAIGQLPHAAFENALLFADRNEMLRLIPKNGVVAEIGVAYGWFSDVIIERLEPKHFYAIDYFSKDNPYQSFWGHNYFRETGMTHEEWYKHKYENIIKQGKMTVCSGISWEEMEKFPNDYFDYIYVDAGHDYSSVKKDIVISLDKIKNGGYVQFNDYTLMDIDGDLGSYYGVVPAVNEMIIKTGAKIIGRSMQILGYDDLLVKICK